MRTPGREKIGGTAEQGYLHCGPNGGGHFVKMVHNGIDYGLMAAYAEGLGILRDANIGKQQHEVDAETTPLRDPEQYQYDFNLRDITEVWRHGSVVASWLLDLTAAALVEDPDLKQFAGRVSDSGEGRWTIKAASSESEAESVEMVFNRHLGQKDMDAYERVLNVVDRDVALTGVYMKRRRMTLTYPALNRSRRILWVVTGAEKAEMLVHLRDGDIAIPAGRIRREPVLVLADQPAAAALGEA